VDIPLGIHVVAAQTDQGDLVRLYRSYVTVGFRTRSGVLLRRRCIVDSGSPLSVVPHDIWRKRNLAWSSVSKTLTVAGQTAALTWQGVPCELGFTEVELAGVRNLTAKFAMQSTALAEVILGWNFLTDNEIELVLRGDPSALSGSLSLP
jgi:hypothetical protein